MQFDLSTPLTLKLMGLGRPLREVERIAGFLMTSMIMVLTIMGYRIRIDGEDSEPDRIPGPNDIPGIHTGFMGSDLRGMWNLSRGCPGSRSPFF